MSAFYEMLGRNIRDARLAKHMTQKQLGQKIGMKNQAVCMYEIGKRRPSLMALSIICDILDVSIDDIIPHVTCETCEDDDQMTIFDVIEEA